LTPDLALLGLALLILVGVPIHAWRVRSLAYAIFGFVVLSMSLPGAVLVHARVRELFDPVPRLLLDGLFLWGMTSAGVHLLSLVRARLRVAPFRWLVSVAGQTDLPAFSVPRIPRKWRAAPSPL